MKKLHDGARIRVTCPASETFAEEMHYVGEVIRASSDSTCFVLRCDNGTEAHFWDVKPGAIQIDPDETEI